MTYEHVLSFQVNCKHLKYKEHIIVYYWILQPTKDSYLYMIKTH